MITLEQLNPHGYETTAEIDVNLATLLSRVNQLQKLCGLPFEVSSGLRSLADQMRINPKAPHSKHLIGAAVDIRDADGKIKAWINHNPGPLALADLYCENFNFTPTWVHFQCIAPASGNRFFIP